MIGEDKELRYDRSRREDILKEIKYYKYKIKLLNEELRELNNDICYRSGCDFFPWEKGGTFYFRKCKICGKLETTEKVPSTYLGSGEVKVRRKEM